MKKFSNYFFVAIAALTMLFTSCTDDTDPMGPSITFKAGDGLTTGDVTVNQGDTVYFSWEANKGDANLDEFTIRNGAIDVSGFPNTDIDKDQYEDTYATILVDAAVYTFTFIATDKDGLQDIATIVVTAEENASPIETYTVTLGAQGATLGSSFASIDGSVYNQADAIANSSNIDFMAFHGTDNAATLASPADTDAQSVFAFITDANGFSVINDTKLGATSLSATDFDAIVDDAAILSEAASATDSKVNQLAVGDVVVFETASTSAHASKFGLAKVTAVPSDRTGSISLVVKVQE